MGRWSDRLEREQTAGQERSLLWGLVGCAGLCLIVGVWGLRALLAEPEPLTRDEVQAFAQALERALNQGDSALLDRRLDAVALARRAEATHPQGASLRPLLSAVIEARQPGDAVVAQLVDRQARWRFLRVLPGQPVPVVFRELGARDLDYPVLYLARGPDGDPSWVDMLSTQTGERLSASVLREAARAIPLDVGAEDLRVLDQQLEELGGLLADGQDRAVLEAFYKVPRSVRGRPLELLRLQAAARIGDRAYASALADLEDATTQGEDYELVLFEHLLAAGRLDRALTGLDRLELALGGDDAHLLALRARIRLRQRDLPRAAARAHQALEREPDLLSALFTGLDVALEQQDHPWTAELLTALRGAGEDLAEDVARARAFEAFRGSSAYAGWQAQAE